MQFSGVDVDVGVGIDRRCWRPAIAALLWCCASTPVMADSVAHTVQAGDTLEGLAKHYLNAPQQWPLLQKHNAVADPRRLRPGSVLHIPAHLLPSAPAQIDFVQGEVLIHASASASTRPLQPGSPLPEGTRLQVGANSFVVVRLADGSVVRVPAQSEVQLQQLRRTGRTGQVRSVIELRSGSLDAEVPTTGDAHRRFEIRTPRAATSVRGTRFGVLLASDGRSSTSVQQGSVAVQALAATQATANANATDSQRTLLDPGQGVAVAPDGTLGAVRALLPAPDLSAVPTTLGDAGMVALALGPQNAIEKIANSAYPAWATGQKDPKNQAPVLYQVQIARDEGLRQVLRNGIFAADAIRLPGLQDGQYVLAVRALDGAGLAGPFARRALSIKSQPVAPLYQSPLPGATVASSGATLQCTEVPGVARFHLQIARRADFAKLAQDAPDQPSCQLHTRALAVGAYYWRAASVRLLADGSADHGPFAAPQPFNVADRPSALAADALRIDQQETSQTLQLHWPAQPGQRFRLQCARDLAFTELLCDEALTTAHWQASALPAGAYFVRLQTRDPSGLESDFSAPRSIYIDARGVQSSDGLSVSASDGQPLGRR